MFSNGILFPFLLYFHETEKSYSKKSQEKKKGTPCEKKMLETQTLQ